MAVIYHLDAYRPNQRKQNNPPLTRNQEILAGINAMWAARTPEEIRLAEIRGTEEELKAVQRRYDRLVEALPPNLWPSEIARQNRQKEAGEVQGKGIDKANGFDTGYSI